MRNSSRITMMYSLALRTDEKTKKFERSELSKGLEITSPSGTRNTAGMTSEGCFVEFVLEHEPPIAACYVTCGLGTRCQERPAIDRESL